MSNFSAGTRFTTGPAAGGSAPKPTLQTGPGAAAPQAAGGDAGLIKEATDASFMADVVEASRQQPVIVDFWAPWCGPCRMMAPQFEAAAQQLEPRVRLAKVNTEAAQNLAARYNIRSIPTLALFVNGREVARQPGAMGAADIVRWVRSQGF